MDNYEKLWRDAEERIAEMTNLVSGLERTQRSHNIIIGRLENELKKATEEETPENREVKMILEAWKRELGKERHKIPLTGERAKVVARAMTHYSVAELLEAIEGLKLYPNLKYGVRVRKGGDRRDDLVDAFKNETTIDRLIEFARGREPEPEAPITFDEFVGLLDRAKGAAGGQWTARCPAHDDEHESLSFRQGERGIVAHCHAGCSASEIAAALEVPLARWFENEDEGEPTVEPKLDAAPLPDQKQLDEWCLALWDNEKLLARLKEIKGWSLDTLKMMGVGYDSYTKRLVLPVYEDEALINVMKYSPALKPKMLSVSGRPRGLFPYYSTIASNETIWLVEGEGDAITATELGLVAFGVPGANGWRSEWAQRFRRFDVVVCCDCDGPGRSLAAKIAADIEGATVVDLDEERTDGYDLTDAAREGCTREILERMVVTSR